MSTTTVSAFETTAQKSQIWLQELADIAYTAMRAVLHCLRDRLTVDEGGTPQFTVPAADPRRLIRGVEALGDAAQAAHPAGIPGDGVMRCGEISTWIRNGRWTRLLNCWNGRSRRVADVKLTMPAELLQLWPNTETPQG